MLPRVSIIVPHYLGNILTRCIESLSATQSQHAFEILVVDDQPCSDGTLETVRDRFPAVRIVKNQGRRGFGGATNSGIRAATGEYIAVLNNDVIVPPHWLDPLVETLDEDPRTGVCAPKNLSLHRPTHFDYAGAAGGGIDTLGFPFANGRLFGHVEEDRGQYDGASRVFWVSGCAMLMRRAALEQTGLFDERLYMQMEEIDICWRMQLHGFRVRIVPRVFVLHYGGYTLPVGSLEKSVLNYRNNLTVMFKNLEGRNLCWIFPLRVALQGFTAVLAVLRPREWRHPLAAALGFAGFTLAFMSTWRSRREVQSRRSVGDRTVLATSYRGLLVWDYFVMGRREASCLPARRPRLLRTLLPLPWERISPSESERWLLSE